MALMSVRTVTTTAAAVSRSAVALTDTISGSDIGDRGLILDVNNGAGAPITVTVSDPGTTPAGNPAANSPAGKQNTVTNGTARQIWVGPKNVDPATGLATITYSSLTTITSEAYKF